MGVEPERKFLVKDDSWKQAVTDSTVMSQAYLSKEEGRTVRVRLSGDEAFITIKGTPPEGTIDTPEYEYQIPKTDAEDLLKMCLPGEISKTRHYVEYAGKTWEIDVFNGSNKGLVIAEIELAHGQEAFEKPAWLGDEVTHDKKYKNAALSENPYSEWKKNPPVKINPPKPRL